MHSVYSCFFQALSLAGNYPTYLGQTATSITSPADSASTVQDQLQVSVAGVEGSLKRLDRIAVIILHATESSLARRIQAFAERSRDRLYEEQVDMVLTYRFQNALPPGLSKILRDSILHRYYRIQYERSHHVPEASTLEKPVSISKQLLETPAEPSSHSKPTVAEEPENLPAKALSETKTTPLTLDEDVIREELRQGLSLPVSRKNVDIASQSETGDALYPNPPEIEKGSAFAKCPICLKDYDVETFEGFRWRYDPCLCVCRKYPTDFCPEPTLILICSPTSASRKPVALTSAFCKQSFLGFAYAKNAHSFMDKTPSQ